MIKGIYRSASAMVPRIKRQESIANNLANASSPGYKKDVVFTQELTKAEQRTAVKRTDWQTPMIDQVYTSYEQGGLDQTGNALDLAIEGEGFFVFESTEGDQLLSRAGNLTVDGNGFVTNAEGNRLLGTGGPITVGGGEIAISENGQVNVDGATSGSIRVATIENLTDLNKFGNNSFLVPEDVELIPAAKFAIRQGYIEGSNVKVVSEMIDMISSFRSYEADANSIKAQDDSLEKLFSNVARPR